MNKLVKRGISAYRVFLKNKLAMAIMMLVSGVMMFIAAVKGKGNDTVMMPLGITLAGAVLTFWAFYRIGYIKSNLDRAANENDKSLERAAMTLQILETALYFLVAAAGVFLLINQDFTDKVLNLMAGGFTTLNGIMGVAYLIKNREHRDFKFWFKAVLTLVELGFGLYFVITSDEIAIGWYIAMGVLTTVAGTIEVVAALKTPDVFRNTMQDGRDILRILKDDQREMSREQGRTSSEQRETSRERRETPNGRRENT